MERRPRRQKTVLKWRRGVRYADRQPCWIVGWWHWCAPKVPTTPRLKSVSRYAINRFSDDQLTKGGVLVRCPRCMLRMGMPGPIPAAVRAEAALVAQLRRQ